MSGIRTKTQLIRSFSSQLTYDIYVFVETWLTSDFYDHEYFDANLFSVYRKDRDAFKTGCTRGGGLLIAVRRVFRSSLVVLEDNDSVIDQLCICVCGAVNPLFVCASYIPPNSSDTLYRSHINNISALAVSITDEKQLCVLGDFNLCNVNWSYMFNNIHLTPSNVESPSEIYFIDNILALDLMQINGLCNKLNRFLDLIFISKNMNFNISECLAPITPCGMHHIPIVLKLQFYQFHKCSPSTQLSFNYNSCDFIAFNELLLSYDWDQLLFNLDVANSFNIFKSKITELCHTHIPIRKINSYKLPWYNRGLKD